MLVVSGVQLLDVRVPFAEMPMGQANPKRLFADLK
jgi:hypothetical protein